MPDRDLYADAARAFTLLVMAQLSKIMVCSISLMSRVKLEAPRVDKQYSTPFVT